MRKILLLLVLTVAISACSKDSYVVANKGCATGDRLIRVRKYKPRFIEQERRHFLGISWL